MADSIEVTDANPVIDFVPQTSYKVNGFRSLIGFELELTSGINVLVGPNGSGKTNFLDFLEFIADVLRYGASTAVSSAGGLSRVFSLETLTTANPTIKAAIHGSADFALSMTRNDEKRHFIFNYDIEIKYNRKSSLIYISKESILFKHLRRRPTLKSPGLTVGTIALSRKSAAEDQPPLIDIGPKLGKQKAGNPLTVSGRYSTGSMRTAPGMIAVVAEMTPSPDESILGLRSRIPAMDAIRGALIRGRTFNISPSRARSADELTKVPGISTDGHGLASTLNALQILQKGDSARRASRLPRATAETLESIIEWTKLVLPSLHSIQVAQDVHSGTYVASLTMQGEKSLKIPLKSASDGTVKWLALVAYIHTSSAIFSLEEPENFLHPKMQEFFVALMRDSLTDEDPSGCFVISTHSETLINQCKPEELIIFSFENNRTSCGRIRDPSKVQREINETGFGLGYYYASNAVA